MKFIKSLIKKPVTMIMLCILILGLGILATFNMPINLLPDMNIPVLAVSVGYPGASADTVQEEVTSPLEKSLKSVAGVTDLTTYSAENVSTVILYFDYGVNVADKKNSVQEKIDALSFPSTALKPQLLTVDLNATATATLSMYSENNDMKKLAKDVEIFRQDLESVNGVGSVTVQGLPSYELNITPKVYKFGEVAYSFDSAILLIAEALSEKNSLDLPIGSVMNNGDRVIIRNITEASTLADIKNIPVSIAPAMWLPLKMALSMIPGVPPEFINTFPSDAAANMVVPISFIADIPDSYNEVYSSYSYINSKKAVSLSVNKLPDANTAEIVDNVRAKVTDFSGESKIVMLDDQSEFINDSIMSVLTSMLIGGILAIAIIFLFLRNIKSSIIIAITMPLSVVAALGLLFLFGVSLNMVSLGGLAVGIGMLVDNSIVVIESITRHRDRGENAFKAALGGTKSVVGSIFASTLTTICVFFPILFTGGLTAEIFTDLSLAVIFSLSFSFIVAVTAIPCLYSLINGGKKHFLEGSILNAASKPKAVELAKEPLPIVANTAIEITTESAPPQKLEPAMIKKSKGKIMEKTERGYSKILPIFLRKKAITIVSAFAVFALSIMLVFTTGMEFLPSIDKGLIEVNVDMGSVESSVINDKTTELAKKIETEIGGIETLSYSAGKSSILQIYPTGNIRVQLKKSGNTQDVVEKIRDLGKQVSDVQISVKEIDGVVAAITGGMGDGISMEIYGQDLTVLKEISQKVQNDLVGKEGFRSSSDNLSATVTEYKMVINKKLCAENNIDYNALVLTLRTGISGMSVTNFKEDTTSVGINLAFKSGSYDTLDELKNYNVGNNLKLVDVAEFKELVSNAEINTKGGKYLLNISVQTFGIDTGSASKTFTSVVDNVLKDYNGYSYSSSGVQAYLSDAFNGLFIALIISFFLLFAVMAAQFESVVKPLIVMLSIPLSFTGGFIALCITGTSLNVVSFIGIIMLMGVIVNNAIVMIDKIEALKKEGVNPYDAVVMGATSRLRPILMTTLTTVLALLPLSFGIGSGSELMQPLGIVVMGGLIVGTLVTLVLIPAIYCAFTKIKAPKKETKSEPTNAELNTVE